MNYEKNNENLDVHSVDDQAAQTKQLKIKASHNTDQVQALRYVLQKHRHLLATVPLRMTSLIIGRTISIISLVAGLCNTV